MLERRDLSRRELVKRLVEKDETPEAAEAAAARMEELGFIDDARYAPRVAQYGARKGWGRRRIEAELLHRGIDRALCAEALETLPPPDDALDRLLCQRLRGAEISDRAALKKATDALQRRGFSWGDIEAAVRRYKEAESEVGGD